MKWRTVGEQAPPEDKPTLAAVLDHYGANYNPSRRQQMISCLLHDDRTPSMSVDFRKEVFNCHSCGKGGDSYTLIMEREGIDFAGARELAEQHGLQTEARQGDERRGRFERPLPQRDRGKTGGGYVPRWRRD